MQFTQGEIEKALDACLDHIANGWVLRQIVNHAEFGYKSAVEAARKAAGVGGSSGPGTLSVDWNGEGIRITSVCRKHEMLLSFNTLVDRAYERAGVGQQTLF